MIKFDIIFCFLADAVLAIFFNGLITFVVPGAWDGFDSFAGPFPLGEEEVAWNFCKPIILEGGEQLRPTFLLFK